MKHVDVKSFLIGVLFTLLVFVSIGADEGKPTDGNLGDIVVNSITIKDNGYVQTYNKYQEPTAYIGSNRDMDGVIVLKDRYGALGYTQSGKKWK